jgi:hypothetical protein
MYPAIHDQVEPGSVRYSCSCLCSSILATDGGRPTGPNVSTMDDTPALGARDDDLHVVDRPEDRDRRVQVGRRRLRQRVRVVGGQPPAGALGDRLLARRRQLPVGPRSALEDRLLQVLLGPPVLIEQPRVLGVEHHVDRRERPHQRAGAADRVGQVRRQLLGHDRVPGLDVQHRADDGRRAGAVGRRQPVVHVQRRPRGRGQELGQVRLGHRHHRHHRHHRQPVGPAAVPWCSLRPPHALASFRARSATLLTVSP